MNPRSKTVRNLSPANLLQLLYFSTAPIFSAGVAGGEGAKEEGSLPGLTAIETTLVDDRATGYGTFQSHNQKVVSNKSGIFMTHIRSRNEAYTGQEWRLSWSRDGGKTFATVHQSINATSAPALETDAAGNLYLARPDFLDGNAYLYRFLAEDKYTKPAISQIPEGSAGKYCMAYDSRRKQLYYFAHNNTFHIVGLDGQVASSTTLLRAGKSAALQYPLLSLDRDGILHAAWTTQRHGVYLYWDIHCMRSTDGGRSWEKLDGTPLSPPLAADESGPTDRITLDDEFEVHTWLSSFLSKDGKLHFVYLAQAKHPRQHYVRYDLKKGKKDIDVWPELKGKDISLRGLDGFFATRAELENATLYCVLARAEEGRVACLASDDNGETWYDYALSKRFKSLYAIGGCRELSEEGQVLGSFTEQGSQRAPGHAPQVYFFKFLAGLSSARVKSARHAQGKIELTFTDVRGQPAEVRFRQEHGSWSDWRRFEARLKAPMEFLPSQFQLKSRLGVVSAEYEVSTEAGQ